MIHEKEVFVFDLDGTLIDSNHIKAECFFDLCDSDDEKAILDNLLLDPSFTRFEMFSTISKVLNLGSNYAERKLAEINLILRRRIAECEEIEGATELLRAIRPAGKKICISSMTPQKEIGLILQDRNWTGLISTFYGSPQKKTVTIQSIISTYKITRPNIVVIGDGADDYLSAQENRIDFIPVGEGRGSHNLPIETLLSMKSALVHSK